MSDPQLLLRDPINTERPIFHVTYPQFILSSTFDVTDKQLILGDTQLLLGGPHFMSQAHN